MADTRKPPSRRQGDALKVIRTYVAERGMPPTLRELGQALEIGSTHGVSCLLDGLIRKGWLRKDEMKSRGLQLVNEAGEIEPGGMASAVMVQPVAKWLDFRDSPPIGLSICLRAPAKDSRFLLGGIRRGAYDYILVVAGSRRMLYLMGLGFNEWSSVEGFL